MLKNSLMQTLGAFGTTILNFLLTLSYAGILGPEKFGSLVTSQAHVLIWSLLVDLGLSQAMISALASAKKRSDNDRQEFRARDLIFRVLGIRLSGAVIGGIAVLFFSYRRAMHGDSFDTNHFVQDIAFMPQLFALAFQQTAIAYGNFCGRQRLSVTANFSGNFVTALLAMCLAFMGRSIPVLLLAQSWGGFLVAIIILSSFLISKPAASNARVKKQKEGPWKRLAWSAIQRDAWPYALIFATTVLWSRMDQITASNLLGEEIAGNYALAVRLVAIPTLMISAISLAIFPDMQRMGHDDPKKIHIYIGLASKLVFRYGVIAFALILFCIGLLFGPIVPKFKSAIHLLPWFIPGVWAYCLHNFFISALYGLRKYKKAVFAHLYAVSIYSLSLYFLPQWIGIQGIIWSYNIFTLVLAYSSWQYLKPNFPSSFQLVGSLIPEESILLGSILKRVFNKD